MAKKSQESKGLPPQRLELWQRNWTIDQLLHWQQRGVLYLDAPYQRGVVWSPERQRKLIFSVIIGLPIPSLIANDRSRAEYKEPGSTANQREGYTIIDGKQRATALLAFLRSELKVPREWFEPRNLACTHMERQVAFSDLTIGAQRRFEGRGLAVTETCLDSLEKEQAVFDLVNFGGVPQGQSDLIVAKPPDFNCDVCGNEDRNVCQCPQDCTRCHRTLYLEEGCEWPGGDIYCGDCATWRCTELEGLLRGIQTAFAPVASWYLPEGEEHVLTYYPKAIEEAVADAVSDRNENLALRKLVRPENGTERFGDGA